MANACNIQTTNACDQQKIITNEGWRMAVVRIQWMSIMHFPSLTASSRNKLLSMRHYKLWILTRALLLKLNIVDRHVIPYSFLSSLVSCDSPLSPLSFSAKSICNLAMNVKKIMDDRGPFGVSSAPSFVFYERAHVVGSEYQISWEWFRNVQALDYEMERTVEARFK